MEKIPNPFREAWMEFDRSRFKGEINAILDEIIDNEGMEEKDIEELDDAIGYMLLLLRYKDTEYMDVVTSSELPEDILEDLGLYDHSDVDIEEEDAYIPVMLIKKYIDEDRIRELEEAGIIDREDKRPKDSGGEKKNKNGKNLWLI